MGVARYMQKQSDAFTASGDSQCAFFAFGRVVMFIQGMIFAGYAINW